MRIMALDVGTKTIGVAVSDETRLIANGVKTIERKNIKVDTSQVIDLIKETNSSILVIGLPKRLDGSDSEQTERVYAFKEKLENKLISTGNQDIKIEYWDERFTTVIATDVLISADMSRKKRKTVVDKMAATIILQGYLDFLRNSNPIT